jgi:NAD/NADP transhydrogenase beta subunit
MQWLRTSGLQVGLAAVTTSIANYMLHDPATAMDTTHLVSTYLGTFVGAVTLTGANFCSLLQSAET